MIPLFLAVAVASTDVSPPWHGYLDETAFAQRLAGWSTDHPDRIRLETYGTSREGRPLVVATLSSDLETADERPALLVVAGLDGLHAAGTEYAVRVAEALLEADGDLLDEVTIHILPRANPDALAANAGAVNLGRRGGSRRVDADRDGMMDEDPARDLDGDGVVSMMRWENPRLFPAATHLEDPGEQRLMKSPDRSLGERARFVMLQEGDDLDGDGRVAEDGDGEVIFDRNFPHRWSAHAIDAGPYQLSEPETQALAEFVLSHPRIFASVVYGPHDTMITLPDSKKTDVTKRTPIGIDARDKGLYETLAEAYRSHAGQTRSTDEDDAGSLHSWLYAHRGIPTVAVTGWGRPDPVEPEAVAADEEDAEREDEPDSDEDAPPAPVDAEAAAWLAYSDEVRNGSGFVEWTAFEHPTLGAVEIGGMVPGFTLNPPAEDLDGLGEGHAAFVAALAGMRPRVVMEGPDVEDLGGGLRRVRLAMVNEGTMPTRTAMARANRAIRPIVIRFGVDRSRLLEGRRVDRIDGLDGRGGRSLFEWVYRADDGPATIVIDDPVSGSRTIEVGDRGSDLNGGDR